MRLNLSILSVLLFAAQISQAFTHKIINATPFNTSVKVFYSACRDEAFDLAPGATKELNGKGCTIGKSGVQAIIHEEIIDERQVRGVANIKNVTASKYSGRYTGSATCFFNLLL